jgi:Na+-driven multidrug efflux pump
MPNNSVLADISADTETEQLRQLSPLRLLVTSSIGPVLTELVSGVFGVVSSFWVDGKCGEEDLAAVSFGSAFDSIMRAFEALVSVAAPSHFAQRRSE